MSSSFSFLNTLMGIFSNLKVRQVYVLLILFTALLYGNTLLNSYNMDDTLVTQHHRFTSKGFAGISDILKSPYYSDNMGYSYEYRPVTHISFAVEHQFFGEHPAISHAINVLLYGLTAILVFYVLQLLFPVLGLAFTSLVSLLFIAHPIHTEVVNSIKNRDEILALLFALLSLIYALQYINRGTWWRWILVPMFLLLALLSKTSAASFMLIIPVACTLQSTSSKKYAAILVASLLPLLAYIELRGYPWVWFRNSLLLLSFCYLILLLFQKVQGQEKLYFKKVISPTGWPKFELNQHLTFTKLTSIDVLLAVLVFSFFFFGLQYREWEFQVFPYQILIVPWLVLQFLPFWTGQYRSSYFLLSLFILMVLSQPLDLKGIGFLMMIYVLILKKRMGLSRKGIVNLIIGGLVLTKCMEELFDPDWMPLDIVTSWPLPFVGIALCIRFPNFYQKYKLWVWGLAIGFYATFPIFEYRLDYLAALTAAIFAAVYFTNNWPKKWPQAEHILPVLLVLFFALEAIPFDRFFNPEALTETAIEVNEPEDKTKGTETSSILEDRPLDFAEYPLKSDAPLEMKIGTSAGVLLHYFNKMIVPWPMGFYYGYNMIDVIPITNPKALLSLVLHAILALLMLWSWKSHPPLSFGIGTYLSSIILFSNLFTPVAGMIGDRLTYVASFGFILAFSYILWLLFQRLPQDGKLIFVILIGSGLIAFSVLTAVRNTHWKDRLTLMNFDISYLSNSAQAHNQLARAYMEASFSPEGKNNALELRNNAVIQFKKALEIYPNFFNVWYDLGRTYMILNKPAAAISCYKQMTQIDSTYIDAYLLTASNAEQVGDFALAEEYYRKSIRNFPNMVDGYTGLTGFLIKTGKLEESKEIALQGLEHHSNNQTLIQMLLRVSELEQDTASGIKYWDMLQNLK